MNPVVPVALALSGAVAAGLGARSLWRRAAERRLGELVAVDAGRPATLRSERYRLVGRPDLLRRRPDGRWVPIELKHRPAPRRGPFPSHLVQLAAYCLLIEDLTGRAPPFGVLRYVDGEVTVPFDAALRGKVLSVLAAVRGPYDGRADPSPAKCHGCPWSASCDASLGNAG